MKHILTYLSVLALTAAGAVAHGYVTNRWQATGAPAAFALPNIPDISGDWHGEPMPSGLANDATLSNVTRKYTNAKTNRVFTVSLTLGPAGLVAQHTPEYCYPGSGYKAIGQTQSFRAAEQGAFRTAVFRKPGSDSLRICWAWSPDGTWSAPQVPELSFLRGSLYKLYVVSWESDRTPEDDAELKTFLTELLKTLHASLFS